MMTPAEKMLAWFLRGTAVILLSAALAVVMPTAWMSALNDSLGLAPLPEGPLVEYLTRSISALYAALGASYWYISLQVRRFLPLIRFGVPLTLLFGAVLVAIDVQVSMPIAWTAVEGPFLLVWSLLLWWLVRRVESTPSPPGTPGEGG